MSGPSVPHVPVRIAVVGAGALGCAVLPRLARMRVGGLTVIDGDRVEAANLDRQELYAEVDIGHPKATTARGWLHLIGPALEVVAVDRFLDATNARELLGGHHAVVECTDDLHARNMIDEVCGELGLPLVSGAVHGRQGQVIVLHAPGEGAALGRRHLFTGRPGGEQDGCDMQHVPDQVIAEVGRRMAARMHDLIMNRPVVNGGIDAYLHERHGWTWFDPPVLVP